MDGGTKLVFLPESHTDFVTRVSVETWIVGVLAVALIGVAIWFWRKRRS